MPAKPPGGYRKGVATNTLTRTKGAQRPEAGVEYPTAPCCSLIRTIGDLVARIEKHSDATHSGLWHQHATQANRKALVQTQHIHIGPHHIACTQAKCYRAAAALNVRPRDILNRVFRHRERGQGRAGNEIDPVIIPFKRKRTIHVPWQPLTSGPLWNRVAGKADPGHPPERRIAHVQSFSRSHEQLMEARNIGACAGTGNFEDANRIAERVLLSGKPRATDGARLSAKPTAARLTYATARWTSGDPDRWLAHIQSIANINRAVRHRAARRGPRRPPRKLRATCRRSRQSPWGG